MTASQNNAMEVNAMSKFHVGNPKQLDAKDGQVLMILTTQNTLKVMNDGDEKTASVVKFLQACLHSPFVNTKRCRK